MSSSILGTNDYWLYLDQQNQPDIRVDVRYIFWEIEHLYWFLFSKKYFYQYQLQWCELKLNRYIQIQLVFLVAFSFTLKINSNLQTSPYELNKNNSRKTTRRKREVISITSLSSTTYIHTRTRAIENTKRGYWSIISLKKNLNIFIYNFLLLLFILFSSIPMTSAHNLAHTTNISFYPALRWFIH